MGREARVESFFNFDPGGNIVSILLCGLGIATNNQSQKYALLLSLEHAISLDILFIAVIEDSLMIVSHTRHYINSVNKYSG